MSFVAAFLLGLYCWALTSTLAAVFLILLVMAAWFGVGLLIEILVDYAARARRHFHRRSQP